eukprot:1921594-Rhodomonas_salina.1
MQIAEALWNYAAHGYQTGFSSPRSPSSVSVLSLVRRNVLADFAWLSSGIGPAFAPLHNAIADKVKAQRGGAEGGGRSGGDGMERRGEERRGGRREKSRGAERAVEGRRG